MLRSFTPCRDFARRRRKCAVSAIGVEEKVIAPESAQGEVRRKRALVWRRRCSGRLGVRAGNVYAGGEDRICVEERAFRARWGARRARREVDA